MKSILDKIKTFQPIDYLTIGVVVVSLLVSIIFLVIRSGKVADTELQLEENRSKIVTLTAKRDALVDDKANLVSEEDAAQILKSARETGIAVANLQTEYQDCVVYLDTDTVSVEEKVTKQAESIGRYLTDDAQGARVPWFVRSNSEMVGKSRFTWRFMTNYGFTTDSIDVLWLCFDSGEKLVAFTTGTYIASQDKFSNIKYFATAYGNANYRTTDDSGSLWVEAVNDDDAYMLPDSVLDQNQQPSTPVDSNPVDPSVGATEPNAPANPSDGLNWAEDFENEFKLSKEYREWVQQQIAAGNPID